MRTHSYLGPVPPTRPVPTAVIVRIGCASGFTEVFPSYQEARDYYDTMPRHDDWTVQVRTATIADIRNAREEIAERLAQQ